MLYFSKASKNRREGGFLILYFGVRDDFVHRASAARADAKGHSAHLAALKIQLLLVFGSDV